MNLFASVHPFLVWLRVVGMFSIPNDELKGKKKKAQIIVQEIFFLSSLVIASILVILNFSFVCLKNVWTFAMFFGFFNFFVIFVNQRLKRRAIWNFLSLLHNIDQKVSEITVF